MTDHIEYRAICVLGTLRSALDEAGELIEHLRAENADLRKQLEQRAEPEPTVIEGWTIRITDKVGSARMGYVERSCLLHDDGTFEWSPWGTTDAPERARLEVEYQLLAARARREGWTWRAARWGGLIFDPPRPWSEPWPAHILALAKRAKRRIAG